MRYTNMKKVLFGLLVAGFLSIMFSSCGSSRSSCNTKNKTRVEMGFM